MKQFQIVVTANNPNSANMTARGASAEPAGKTGEKGNNPNNRNNASGYMSILIDFLPPRILGLLGLLYIYLIILDSYVKNLSTAICAPLRLLAPAGTPEACHG